MKRWTVCGIEWYTIMLAPLLTRQGPFIEEQDLSYRAEADRGHALTPLQVP